MSTQLINLVQEIYFDFCDILDHNELEMMLDGFQEFDDLREFILEQKHKISQIEKIIERKQSWA